MIKLLKRITEPSTADAEPTIRDTGITVDQIHRELMLRVPSAQMLATHPELTEEDIQAVWVYKSCQNNRDGVIDRQELISSLSALPEQVRLLDVFDHVDFLFSIQRGVSDAVYGKAIPHEQVMREMRAYITGLKADHNP